MRRSRYTPPSEIETHKLSDLLKIGDRSIASAQGSFLEALNDQEIYCAGNLGLLGKKSAAVIGSRNVSPEGVQRARQIARHLAAAGIVVTSGLAKGVDTAAHEGALANGGSTIAVIGTPLAKAYPAENSALQEEIYSQHLLISQFAPGARTFPSDFPKRNRVMAALSDASIIVEASDTSGTLHQAAECVRLGRWLFIMKSVAENPDLEWPAKFLRQERVAVLTSAEDVIERIK
ncbi:DNA-processing protein DprA [Aureimonas leprariae]|uniref:DNA-processing protein DprA n=2 Tax=Plantimonas leprariae TaxID=2615207 RepID=A0A7V7PSK0_9HYPH|nr:DNA-processing protein DprA [Aureimonas leprariae]